MYESMHEPGKEIRRQKNCCGTSDLLELDQFRSEDILTSLCAAKVLEGLGLSVEHETGHVVNQCDADNRGKRQRQW